MQVTGTTDTQGITKYSRLSSNDIARMPALKINRADFYQGSSPIKPVVKKAPDTLRNKIFTALTFGIVGLYLAHRQNLFNPIRREAKKILKSETLKNKVLEFAKDAVNPETYKKATRTFLNLAICDKNRPATFVENAQKILADEKLLEKLDDKVLKHLSDDSNTERLKQGFAVDIMDRMMNKIEKSLKQMKECGQEYKNKTDLIVSSLFDKTPDTQSIAQEALYKSITNRSSVLIENFIKDI